MNAVDLDRRAALGTAALVDATSPDQYGAPTPCPDWTVRDLLTHLIAGNVKYIEIGRGKEWARGAPDVVFDDDPGAMYRRTMDAMRARAGQWRRPRAAQDPGVGPQHSPTQCCGFRAGRSPHPVASASRSRLIFTNEGGRPVQQHPLGVSGRPPGAARGYPSGRPRTTFGISVCVAADPIRGVSQSPAGPARSRLCPHHPRRLRASVPGRGGPHEGCDRRRARNSRAASPRPEEEPSSRKRRSEG